VVDQVAKFKVRPPTVVAPSLILFSVSLTIVSALVVAEAISRRFKYQNFSLYQSLVLIILCRRLRAAAEAAANRAYERVGSPAPKDSDTDIEMKSMDMAVYNSQHEDAALRIRSKQGDTDAELSANDELNEAISRGRGKHTYQRV